jgi:hypothetical protein
MALLPNVQLHSKSKLFNKCRLVWRALRDLNPNPLIRSSTENRSPTSRLSKIVNYPFHRRAYYAPVSTAFCFDVGFTLSVKRLDVVIALSIGFVYTYGDLATGAWCAAVADFAPMPIARRLATRNDLPKKSMGGSC